MTEDKEVKKYTRKKKKLYVKKPRKRSIRCKVCEINFSGIHTCPSCRKLLKNNKKILGKNYWHRIELLEDKKLEPMSGAIQNPHGQWFVKIKNLPDFLKLLKDSQYTAIVRNVDNKLFIQLMRG